MRDSDTSDIAALALRPDYHGNSIVNLMSTIASGRGHTGTGYAPLTLLDDLNLENYRTVLLLLIDGLGHEYLTANWPDSIIARHLRGRMTSVFPTTTAAAITTFLTAQAPAQHGLTGWHMWLQEIASVIAVLPFADRHGRKPLVSRGYDPTRLLNANPVYPQLNVDSHVISPKRIANSDFNRAFSQGAEVHAYKDLAGYFSTITNLVLGNSKEKYVYAYWPDLDHHGHESGIASKTSQQHFLQIDEGFGQLLDALSNTDTLVLLTADHGIIDTQKHRRVHLQDHPAMTAMMDVPMCGEPRAAYCYVHDGELTSFRNYVETELSDALDVLPSQVLIDQELFGLGKAHPGLSQRVGNYTLLPRDNYSLFEALPGERRSQLIGVHGGLSSQELYVPLVIAQP